jgi:GTPase SAR1 family protein
VKQNLIAEMNGEKIVLTGEVYVGKTVIFERFQSKDVSAIYRPTIAESYAPVLELANNQKVELRIWHFYYLEDNINNQKNPRA